MPGLVSKYFVAVSALLHISLFLILLLSINWQTPLPVLKNSNKQDIISAVILGDIPESKILPKEETAPPKPDIPKPTLVPVKPAPPAPPAPDAIALKVVDKKKLAEEKMLAEIKKQRLLFEKNLLADIKKQSVAKKKLKQQKQLQSQFTKTFQAEAEKSLREQLLDEEIRLQGKQNRQTQGEINKYKALIIQAISEQWIVPAQANKSLYCELLIRLASGGVVMDVQVTKSSGDPGLDRSARAAVLKASPLPVPRDAQAFNAFKQFALKVKPENILER